MRGAYAPLLETGRTCYHLYMKTHRHSTTAVTLTLLLISAGFLGAKDKDPLPNPRHDEAKKIQERTTSSNQFEDETLQQMLKLTTALKETADPKNMDEASLIELEELLGRACYLETRTFAAYNDPTSLVRRSVPADEKTISKKIMEQFQETKELSQKAIKLFRERKFGPAALRIKEIDKNLKEIPKQYEARRKIRATRIEEKTKK